jgi:hypothetical protein
MNEWQDIQLKNLVIHYVGNCLHDEGCILSKASLQLEEETRDLLLHYFLSPFKNREFFHLNHETDLKENKIYDLASQVFADPEGFFLRSIHISEYLYEQSKHPRIKGGEVYCVYFDNCVVDDELVDAIGIFKSENKETFLKVYPSGDNFNVETENGINIQKLDKGCIIYNTEKDKGYKVRIVDNKSGDAQYWKDDFLKVVARNDSYHYTENYMNLCKSFVTDRMPEDFEVSKTDQIDILNRSASFFKKNESFDLNDFATSVIQQPEIIDSFKDYKKQYTKEYAVPIVDEFDISTQAVKKQAKVFKSVLKLDKNFHIYIHGNKELIEPGFDEGKGLKYYKVYFKEEN